MNVPSGITTLDLSFVYQDASAGKSFYIDNILVKKIDEPNALPLSVIVDEDFSTPSNWIGTNTIIDYSAGTLNIKKDPAYISSSFFATKSVNLLQDQLYKITFSVTPLAMGTSSLSLAFENDENTSGYDYNTPLSNTSANTYTYYVVPKTNLVNMVFNITNTSGTFNFDIDNFKIQHVVSPLQPMYIAVMNNLTDYYAFGMPTPGRKAVASTDYQYGFNGQLKDDEIYGDGNLNSAEFWEYDTRLGRRWNLDPVDQISISNYACFANNPILLTDVNGDIVKYVGSFFTKLRLRAHDLLLRMLSPSARANYNVLKESPLTNYRRASGDKRTINDVDYTKTDDKQSRVEPTDKDEKFSGTVITTDFSQKQTNTDRSVLSKLLISSHEWSHAYDYVLGTRDITERGAGEPIINYNEAKAVHAENVTAAEINRFTIRDLEYRIMYKMDGQYSGADTYRVPLLKAENVASIVKKYYDTYYRHHRFGKGLSTKGANTSKDPRTPVYFWDPLKKYGGRPKN